jgi:hypothetical protein
MSGAGCSIIGDDSHHGWVSVNGANPDRLLPLLAPQFVQFLGCHSVEGRIKPYSPVGAANVAVEASETLSSRR